MFPVERLLVRPATTYLWVKLGDVSAPKHVLSRVWSSTRVSYHVKVTIFHLPSFVTGPWASIFFLCLPYLGLSLYYVLV
ncbi:hypothetical protein N665_0224s0030 [Sinapis alba]|nr:hypothetical protein N665_0224s0030 [Sinapis alba]